MPCERLDLSVVTSARVVCFLVVALLQSVSLPSPIEPPDAECQQDPVSNTRSVYLCTEPLIKCLVFNTLI